MLFTLKGAVQIEGSDITSIDTTPVAPLGTIAVDGMGNAFKYVQNVAGGTTWGVGNVLMPAAATSVAATVTSSTDKKTVSKTSIASTAGAFSGYYLFVSNGGSEGDLRVIAGNDLNNIYLETALTSALNGTSALKIQHPYVCDLSTGSGQVIPVGIAMAAVTVGNYGWAQVEGVGPVKCVNGAITANKNLTTGGSTAGQAIIGVTANGPYDATNIGYVLETNTNSAKNVMAYIQIR